MRKGCSAKLGIVLGLSPSRYRNSTTPWGTVSWWETMATGSWWRDSIGVQEELPGVP